MQLEGNRDYTVVSAIEHDGLRLLRLRNPFPNGQWTGNFADDSQVWTADLKADLEFDQHSAGGASGQFWMQLEDFLFYFFEVHVTTKIATWSFDGTDVFTLEETDEMAAGRPLKAILFEITQETSAWITLHNVDERVEKDTEKEYPALRFEVVKTNYVSKEHIQNQVSPSGRRASMTDEGVSLVSYSELCVTRDICQTVNLDPGHYTIFVYGRIPVSQKRRNTSISLTFYSAASIPLAPQWVNPLLPNKVQDQLIKQANVEATPRVGEPLAQLVQSDDVLGLDMQVKQWNFHGGFNILFLNDSQENFTLMSNLNFVPDNAKLLPPNTKATAFELKPRETKLFCFQTRELGKAVGCKIQGNTEVTRVWDEENVSAAQQETIAQGNKSYVVGDHLPELLRTTHADEQGFYMHVENKEMSTILEETVGGDHDGGGGHSFCAQCVLSACFFFVPQVAV